MHILNLANSYATRIVSNYNAILKINSLMPGLRLISIESNKKNGGYYFKIQIPGKNIFPLLSAKKVKKLMNSFSEEDKKILNKYFLKKNEVSKKIVARTYDRAKKIFIYTVEFYDSKLNTQKYMNFTDISLLQREIDEFDNEDAYLIKQASFKLN